jgi:small subunit ribosomal protein S17
MTQRNKRKTITGIVTSTSMAKTITVKSERKVQHPRYKKYTKKYTTCYAHDEKEAAVLGDKVMLAETRPYSKMKHWRLVEIIDRKEN